MEAKSPVKSASASLPPLTDEQIKEGLDNLEMCLDALDQGGEAGLQKALDRIYPPIDLAAHGLEKVPFPPEFEDSYSIRVKGPSPVKTVPYDPSMG